MRGTAESTNTAVACGRSSSVGGVTPRTELAKVATPERKWPYRENLRIQRALADGRDLLLRQKWLARKDEEGSLNQ